MKKNNSDEYDKIPFHIRNRAENDPQCTIMQWTPTKTFESVNAEDVAILVKYIQNEFVKVLHTSKHSDEEIRTAMLQHPPIRNFQEKYSTIFQKITTREIALNPVLMTPILYQVYILGEVQSNRLSEDQAKALIAKAAFEAVVKEGIKRGAISQNEAKKTLDQMKK